MMNILRFVENLKLNWISGFDMYGDATTGVWIVEKVGKGLYSMSGI